jgi:hypothetical protein
MMWQNGYSRLAWALLAVLILVNTNSHSSRVFAQDDIGEVDDSSRIPDRRHRFKRKAKPKGVEERPSKWRLMIGRIRSQLRMHLRAVVDRKIHSIPKIFQQLKAHAEENQTNQETVLPSSDAITCSGSSSSASATFRLAQDYFPRLEALEFLNSTQESLFGGRFFNRIDASQWLSQGATREGQPELVSSENVAPVVEVDVNHDHATEEPLAESSLALESSLMEDARPSESEQHYDPPPPIPAVTRRLRGAALAEFPPSDDDNTPVAIVNASVSRQESLAQRPAFPFRIWTVFSRYIRRLRLSFRPCQVMALHLQALLPQLILLLPPRNMPEQPVEWQRPWLAPNGPCQKLAQRLHSWAGQCPIWQQASAVAQAVSKRIRHHAATAIRRLVALSPWGPEEALKEQDEPPFLDPPAESNESQPGEIRQRLGSNSHFEVAAYSSDQDSPTGLEDPPEDECREQSVWDIKHRAVAPSTAAYQPASDVDGFRVDTPLLFFLRPAILASLSNPRVADTIHLTLRSPADNLLRLVDVTVTLLHPLSILIRHMGIRQERSQVSWSAPATLLAQAKDSVFLKPRGGGRSIASLVGMLPIDGASPQESSPDTLLMIRGGDNEDPRTIDDDSQPSNLPHAVDRVENREETPKRRRIGSRFFNRQLGLAELPGLEPSDARTEIASEAVDVSSSSVNGDLVDFAEASETWIDDSSKKGASVRKGILMAMADTYRQWEQVTDQAVQDVTASIEGIARIATTRSLQFGQNHLDIIRDYYSRFVALALYKPPVGLVVLWAFTRLFVKQRLFRVHSRSLLRRRRRKRLAQANAKGEGEAASTEISTEDTVLSEQEEEAMRRKRRHARDRVLMGRALSLDYTDRTYLTRGGIDPVRRQLCITALKAILDPYANKHCDRPDGKHEVAPSLSVAPSSDSSLASHVRSNRTDLRSIPSFIHQSIKRFRADRTRAVVQETPPMKTEANADLSKNGDLGLKKAELLSKLRDAISVTYLPGQPRAQYVRSVVEPLAKVEEIQVSSWKRNGTERSHVGGLNFDREAPFVEDEPGSEQIITLVGLACEMQALDAMLR